MHWEVSVLISSGCVGRCKLEMCLLACVCGNCVLTGIFGWLRGQS